MTSRTSLALTVATALGLALAACGDDPKPAANDTADAIADVSPEDVTPDDVAGDTLAPDADDVVVPPDVTAEVALCRQRLADAESYMALEAAEAALAKAPDDPAANFCAALAGLIDRTEFSLSLAKVLDMAGTYNGLVISDPEPSYGDELAEDIHGIFNYLHEGYALAAERLAKVSAADFTFDVDVVWLYNGAHPILAHRGRFDAGDVKLARAMSRFVAGFWDILRGQDLRGDVASLIYFIANDLTGGGFTLSRVADIVAYLLASDARFLTLHPDDGAAAFAEAREVLATFGPDLRDALATIEALRPTDGVAEVTDAESIDDGYVLTAAGRVVTEEDGSRREEPIVVELSAKVLGAFDRIAESVATPGTLVPWDGGVTTMLGAMIGTLIETGGLGDLEIGGVELPPGFFSYEQIGNLLAAVVPSPAAFDFGTFYSQPVGLRGILPQATAQGGYGKDALVTEWECPEDLDARGRPLGPQGFVCSEGAALVDAAHFAGTDDALAADGYTSRFPYFAWEDPTLNGLLWADLTGLYPGAPEGPAAATAATVNVIMAETLMPVLSLLSSDTP